MTTFRFASPEAGGFDAWFFLYREYARAVGDTVDESIARTVWRWLLDGTHRVGGVLAWDGRRLAGFAHYRPFPRTLHGNEACYLDDLYVDAPWRGSGLGAQLIERVGAIARLRGWTEVRWVTTPDNAPARALYERIAVADDLVTYRIRLPQPIPEG